MCVSAGAFSSPGIFAFAGVGPSLGVFSLINKKVFPSRVAYVNGGVTLYRNVFVRGCSSLATYRLAEVCRSPLVVRPS